ncbi:MAG: glycerol-3-phosphate dehydrogenase/oxidase [Acidobacteria bacterium]|nr:glycerol-3-phosphate dehydrogenase/oxidase [Acidobacteriota bacterium]
MSEFSWRTRLENIKRLANEEFDLFIIGGGITGAGLALEAALRGVKVALVEKRDFAAGTSSRSTKLLHGGLRYLEHFDFAMVREGLRERATLMHIAPHLAEPLPFVIPIYSDAKRNYDHPLKMRLGLILYDLLAGASGLARHQRLDRDAALRLAPQLDSAGLQGALLYFDGLTNDSRLTIEVLKTANKNGAIVANYTSVKGFIKDAKGQIAGVRLGDEISGALLETKAKLVINATGVWMDEVRKLDTNHSSLDELKGQTLRPSKGIHLTVSAARLQVKAAWLIPSLTGHRFYFVVPWQGRVNIGTTDSDYHGDKDSPCANLAEVKEILDAINAYFPTARLQTCDVISAWAGLRPLIGDANAKSTTDVSRKELLVENADGLISIAGGKLTTFRLMAERGIDLAVKRLRERFSMPTTTGSRSAKVRLDGGPIQREALASFAQQLAASANCDAEMARHLVNNYGANAKVIAAIAQEQTAFRQPLIEGLPMIFAEVIYAVREEMALTLADVLARRTRAVMLGGDAVLAVAPEVAAVLAQELNWDEQEIPCQLVHFKSEVESEYRMCDRSR